jgi:hypothetical protein
MISWDDLDSLIARPAFGIGAETLTIRSSTGLWVSFRLSKSRALHDFVREHASPVKLQGFEQVPNVRSCVRL